MYFEEYWAVPRMGFSRAINLPYDNEHLESRSVISSSARIRDDLSLHTPCPTPIVGIHLDFDLFVSNVENQIMEDHLRTKGQVVFTPRELMMRSNPAMFNDVKDYTNPRDWYHGIQFQRKQQRSNNNSNASTLSSKSGIQTSSKSGIQGLKRTTSMANLSSAGTVIQKKHFAHSYQNLNEIGEMDGVESSPMTKQASFSLENLHYVREDSKENIKPFNLPQIKSDNFLQSPNENEAGQGREGHNYSLPKLDAKSKSIVNSSANNDDNVENSKTDSEEVMKNSVSMDTVSPANQTNKMDKWITEVSENKTAQKEDDKLLQTGDSVKLQHVPKIVTKNNHSLKRTKLPVLKPMQIFPNQFMELKTEKTMNINREHYKLKQKSLYHLKSLDDERENPHRKCNDTDFESKHYRNNLDKFCIKEKSISLEDIAKARQERGDGPTKVNVDQFAVEAYDIHPHNKFALAKLQQTTEAGVMKVSFPVHWPQYGIHHHEATMIPKLKRENTKASIVNLTMERTSGSVMGRHPTFIRKSNTNVSDPRSENSSANAKIKFVNQARLGGDRSNSENDNNEKSLQPKTSKCVLSKVKQLKVFDQEDVIDISKTGAKGTRQGVYKLDLKNYKSPTEDREVVKSREISNLQDPNVDFQFNTGGEVIITRQSSTAGSSGAQNASASLKREKNKTNLKDIPDEKGTVEDSKVENKSSTDKNDGESESAKVKQQSAKSNKSGVTDEIPDSLAPQTISPRDEKSNEPEQWPEKEKTILDIQMPEKAYDSEVTSNMSPPPPPNTDITESPTKQPEVKDEHGEDSVIQDEVKENSVTQNDNNDSTQEGNDIKEDSVVQNISDNAHKKLDTEKDDDKYHGDRSKDVATSMSSLIDADGRGPDGRQPPSEQNSEKAA